ncbi:hypothetical protein BZG13_14560 [Salinivibrio sp. ML323]|uniref:glycosyltransferase n=1 Tax=Salinivibrio sp. ML323 TaxID=1909474 RepID=UPI000985E9BF|nr:glycosyltransferase [Salinivibrio sp. ML323]OOE56169.1 hypothetical protein BZG13_14560 [Salinivibrio sp. ML323]
MKIAYIITKGEVGGAQTWTRDQVRLFAQSQDQMIITNKKGWLSEECSSLAESFFLPNIERFSLFTFMSLVRLIYAQSVDTMVASSAHAGVYARLCKVVYPRIRIIYVSHGWSCIYKGGRFARLLMMTERILSFLTDIVLCVSEQDKKIALYRLKILPRKVRCLRNSVFPRKKKKELEFRKVFKVLFVGRLEKPKRPDLLIDAIVGDCNFELHVVGDGSLKGTLPVSENIFYHGTISNFDEFHKYDVFALVSDSEGLPMSALEAASTGLPLLLSNVGGCSELISSNGVLVNNNAEDIRRALSYVRDNYSEYSEGAMKKAESFDLTRYFDDFLSIYSSN